jgi:hypothetical protein
VPRPSSNQGRGRPAGAGDFTNKVYYRSVAGRVDRKRKVLDAWAVELRRIVGERPEIEQLALAA